MNQEENNDEVKEKTSNPDTGSSEAQIKSINQRLEKLNHHFEKHPKDKHSRRGLIGLLNRRRKNLKYLEKNK
jgi:small subunit ribosomal protein S15